MAEPTSTTRTCARCGTQVKRLIRGECTTCEWANRPAARCDVCGQSKKIIARGMCNACYTAQHRAANGRNRKKYPIICAWCNEASEAAEPEARYCGLECAGLAFSALRNGFCRIPRYHIARWVGKTCAWKPPLQVPAAYECEWCGKSGQNAAHAKRYCSTLCKHRAKRARRRGAEFNAVGTYTWMEITRLWQSFDQACAYCRTPTPLADIQAEHVEALSRGGANNLTNLLPSCMMCNADKRELSLEEWAVDRAKRGLPAVITSWGQRDRRYRHLVRTTRPNVRSTPHGERGLRAA